MMSSLNQLWQLLGYCIRLSTSKINVIFQFWHKFNFRLGVTSNRSSTSQRQYGAISTPLQENSGYVVPKYDFYQPEEEEKPPDIDLVFFFNYL